MRRLERYRREAVYADSIGVIVETAEEHAARLEQEEEDESAEWLSFLHLPGAHDEWGCDR